MLINEPQVVPAPNSLQVGNEHEKGEENQQGDAAAAALRTGETSKRGLIEESFLNTSVHAVCKIYSISKLITHLGEQMLLVLHL